MDVSPPRHPEAVVFDIGAVLIEWQPEQFYDRLIGVARRKELFATTDLLETNRQVDLGADLRREVYACADRHPEFGAEIRLWHDRWLDMASPAIDGSVALLRALKRRAVPVFALSNFGIETLARAEAAYEFLSEFDRRYVSGHLGVMKPGAEIYEILESDSKVAPAALLFTDDQPANIATAAARGWQVHHFTGADGWRDRLIGAGLLTSEDTP